MKFNVDFSLAKLTQNDKGFVFSLVILSVNEVSTNLRCKLHLKFVDTSPFLQKAQNDKCLIFLLRLTIRWVALC